jgi:hypothetical protein
MGGFLRGTDEFGHEIGAMEIVVAKQAMNANGFNPSAPLGIIGAGDLTIAAAQTVAGTAQGAVFFGGDLGRAVTGRR